MRTEPEEEEEEDELLFKKDKKNVKEIVTEPLSVSLYFAYSTDARWNAIANGPTVYADPATAAATTAPTTGTPPGTASAFGTPHSHASGQFQHEHGLITQRQGV